ncbi:MAG: MFS transporter [Candidatus Nanopelagicales bacterium]
MSITSAPDAVRHTKTPESTENAPRQANRRRALIAGAAGNVVEWYDWTIYALFAIYFSEQFFPNSNPTASLLATFTVFAVGFLARPLGSVLLGRVCDRVGRSAALSVSVMLMAASSLGIAFLPTTASIGIAAAFLLVFLRLVQGLSLGGESAAVGAYLAESAPARRRGLFTSVYPTTIMLGTLMGAMVGVALTTFLSSQQLTSFGWRIPFVIGGVLGIVGFIIRRKSHETLDKTATPEPRPVRTVMKQHRSSIWVTFIIVGSAGLAFFGLVAGFPALAKASGQSGQLAFEANTLALGLLVVLVPISAWVSDRVGRRTVLIVGYVGLAIASIACMGLLASGSVVAAQLVLVVPTAMVQSVLMVTLIERFPSKLRGTGFGLCFAVSVALVGGTAPMLSTWLLGMGLLPVFGIYVAAMCLLAAATAYKIKESAFLPLRK